MGDFFVYHDYLVSNRAIMHNNNITEVFSNELNCNMDEYHIILIAWYFYTSERSERVLKYQAINKLW